MANQHVCSIFRQAGEPVTRVFAFEHVFSLWALEEIRIIMNSVVRTYPHMHHGRGVATWGPWPPLVRGWPPRWPPRV